MGTNLGIACCQSSILHVLESDIGFDMAYSQGYKCLDQLDKTILSPQHNLNMRLKLKLSLSLAFLKGCSLNAMGKHRTCS